jgi:hypothetical protein
MKRVLGFVMVLALFAAPAFASESSENVDLAASVKVGSTQIPAGKYKVTWTGSGASVQVTLAQKGKAPVTVPATVVAEKHVLSAVSTVKQDGAVVLESIELPNVSLVFGTAPTAGQQPSR